MSSRWTAFAQLAADLRRLTADMGELIRTTPARRTKTRYYEDHF